MQTSRAAQLSFCLCDLSRFAQAEREIAHARYCVLILPDPFFLLLTWCLQAAMSTRASKRSVHAHATCNDMASTKCTALWLSAGCLR